jgi:glyoxylate/hydroxypyruvate reductase A
VKVFIYTDLNKSLQDELRAQLPPTTVLTFRSNLSESEVLPAFKQAEVIMGNPPASWFEEPLPYLKFWQIDSAGFNQYQHIRLDVTIVNMGDLFSNDCAETIIGGILAYYRGLNHLIKFQLDKEWRAQEIRAFTESLSSKRVLILGSGTIGLAVRKALAGFGCQIKTTARNNPIADFHSFEEILKALPETDLVINTLPGNLKHYVSKIFIDAMKKGSVYANIGRGNTTDESALIASLTNGHLGGAILDVTEKEPLPKDNPLWTMKNVILTQHTGGSGSQEVIGRVKRFIYNFHLFIQHKEIEDRIELQAGY